MQITIGKLLVFMVGLLAAIIILPLTFGPTTEDDNRVVTSLFPSSVPTCLTINQCRVRLYTDGAWLIKKDGNVLRQLTDDEYDKSQLPKDRSKVMEITTHTMLKIDKKEV